MRKKCPICKNKEIINLRDIRNLSYCRSCHTAWVKKYPPISYDEDYFSPKSSIAGALMTPVFNLFYLTRKRYLNNKRVDFWIDIGAGRGEFLETVDAKHKIGVELAKSALSAMKKAGLDTMTDNEFLRVKNLNADIISFWHVLEHVRRPWEFLDTTRKNLKRNGKIIIGIPNLDSLEFKFFKKYWFHLVPKYHLWHFSPISIERLLRNSGFKIEKINYWSIEHHLTGTLQSFINKSANSDNFLHKVVKRGTGLRNFSWRDIFWTAFWLSLGLPLVVSFFTLGSLSKKPGAFVVVASLERRRAKSS